MRLNKSEFVVNNCLKWCVIYDNMNIGCRKILEILEQ